MCAKPEACIWVQSTRTKWPPSQKDGGVPQSTVCSVPWVWEPAKNSLSNCYSPTGRRSASPSPGHQSQTIDLNILVDELQSTNFILKICIWKHQIEPSYSLTLSMKVEKVQDKVTFFLPTYHIILRTCSSWCQLKSTKCFLLWPKFVQRCLVPKVQHIKFIPIKFHLGQFKPSWSLCMMGQFGKIPSIFIFRSLRNSRFSSPVLLDLSS